MVMNCKKRKAFTLIELMTTTLIMAIIICAAIPFAMKKDIQKRAVAGHIGLFECYYNSSGKLMQHIRTKDGEESRTLVSDGKCVFNPNANYAKGAKNFQIVAIGGGGAGGTYNDQGANDDKLRAAMKTLPKSTDTLDTQYLKYLKAHGRIALGTLSNTGGVNAWYWNGQTQGEQCYREYWRSGCTCYRKNTYGDDNCRCGNSSHQDFKVHCKKTANNSDADYISVYNIGPRLCSVSPTAVVDYNLPEDDIFQAIYKYYGVAGKYTNGDIVYNIEAPSGLSSCHCLNDPTSSRYGRRSCMAGALKYSQAGKSGVAYSYATYTGLLRAAYMGNAFATDDGSRDPQGTTRLVNHCDEDLKLAGTSFGCGTAKSNNECSGQTLRNGTKRGFPKFYLWGNDYHTGTNPPNWYQQIKMSYTYTEGDLGQYGGDVYFRLITHKGGRGAAIVPRGAHGNTSFVTSSSAVNSNFTGFIPGHQGFYSANNPGTACSMPENFNKYFNAVSATIYEVQASCSDSCTYTATCGTGSNAHSCTKTKTCSNTGYSSPYYPSQTKAHAYTYSTNNCTCSCDKYDNVPSKYTESEVTCEDFHCCNSFAKGSKKYTIRYNTGTSLISDTGSAVLTPRSQTLACGSPLYIYRQIKGVPYERTFVASAGQNGSIRQGAYPKLDEQLTLIPGLGGVVAGDDGANGKPSLVKKSGGQVILIAQGGTKGASDKLNDTWVGPCMLFSHRGNFDVKNPGCMARHDIMRKPTYNALLMANMQYLDSVSVKSDNDYRDMPGLGGDGAYANVFPDRFLLSKAIRDEVRLTTTYIGPYQKQPWSKTEGEYTVIGLDAITRAEFIGDDSYAKEYKRRYDLLQTAASNFISDTQHEGRVPNFTKAANGNNGAIVIIW